MSYPKEKRNKTGSPRKFESPDQMTKMIDQYFIDCDNNTIEELDKNGVLKMVRKARPYTITGLCLALGITRQTLLDYEQLEDRQEFADVIKKARLRCENQLEEKIITNNSVGAMFLTKCNFGYIEKQEIKQDQNIKIEISGISLDKLGK